MPFPWLRPRPGLRRAAAGLLMLALLLLCGPAAAEPNTRSTPLGAGCYRARLNRCMIHVEPFSIFTRHGEELTRFALSAAREPGGAEHSLYDFSVSFSPENAYTSSQVARDFAVSCGADYTIILRAETSAGPNPAMLSSAAGVSCPASLNKLYFSLVLR